MKWHETLSDDRYSFCCSHCPQVIFYRSNSSQQLNMNRNLIVIFAQKFKDSKHLTLHLTSIHPDDYPKKSNTARENKLPAFHNAFLCNSEGSSSQQPISNKSAVKVLRNNQILKYCLIRSIGHLLTGNAVAIIRFANSRIYGSYRSRFQGILT